MSVSEWFINIHHSSGASLTLIIWGTEGTEVAKRGPPDNGCEGETESMKSRKARKLSFSITFHLSFSPSLHRSLTKLRTEITVLMLTSH